MNIEKLSELSVVEQSVLYAALLSHVKFGDGYGLINKDRGNSAYLFGVSGDVSDAELGDSPERNTLYKSMKALSRTAFEYGEFAPEDMVADWKKFCILVTRYAKH